MTKQEYSIELLKSYISECEEARENNAGYTFATVMSRRIEYLEYAIDCIEKQIPIKSKERFVGNGWNDIWEGDCPKCGKTIRPTLDWCPYCGQAIDWSEDDV